MPFGDGTGPLGLGPMTGGGVAFVLVLPARSSPTQRMVTKYLIVTVI